MADQMRQELERSRKLNGEIMEMWGRMKEENDSRLRAMEDETDHENEKVEED